MGTYSQWNIKRPLRPVAYICGAEPALVRQVLDAHRPGPAGTVLLFAGEIGESELWDLVMTVPAASGRRTTVLGAERLARTEHLAELAAADWNDGSYTLFVSNEADFPKDPDSKTGKGLAAHLVPLRDSKRAQLIRCCAPTSEDAACKLVASWWPGCGVSLARQLVKACGGQLSVAWQACDKAARAQLPPTPVSLSMVCQATPSGSFADLVMGPDRGAAVAAARQLNHSEIGAAIGLLVARLSTLAVIREGLSQRMDRQDIAAKLRVDRFLLRMLAPLAPAYNPDRVARCREVLALAETAWRGGATAGVGEVIAALW
jgi:hypothetical protein